MLWYTNGISGYATNIGEKREIDTKKFAIALDKFREDVTRDRCEGNSMQEIDNCVSKFEHEVTMMEENFRRMKHNCF